MDKNLARIIKDLRLLREHIRAGTQEEAVQDVAREYLMRNARIIIPAMTTYAEMSPWEREDMHHEYPRVLDYSAIGDRFIPLAMGPLEDAVAGSEIGEDGLNMLSRALAYAGFVVDTADLPLAMQPIEGSLPRELKKVVSFRRSEQGYLGRFIVSGGLTHENKEAFDSLKIQLQVGERPLARLAESSILLEGYQPTASEPFSALVSIPEETYETVRRAAGDAGFVVMRSQSNI